MNRHSISILLCVQIALAGAIVGCQTKAGTGTLAGAGVGALVGQLAGRSTGATLIGAGVGAGVGYLIGNEADKKDARSREQATEAELKPFAGTAWQMVSVNAPGKRPVKSLVARFDKDGNVFTTRTYEDGTFESDSERYRVVGDTLIVNKPDYVINAKYRFDGDRLYLDAGDRSAVFVRA